ncbi:MAG: aldose epimerase [Burkholderiales bacterium PBB4]|nr:MAG: aldose epimerase [Burkholderiales bacterium PBB4]
MSLSLRYENLVCELKPEMGGCIAGLWRNGTAVLQSTPAAGQQSVRQAASYPLLPYSNRIAQAELLWQGQSHTLTKNWLPDPHSIHGVGWERPWEVVSQHAAAAHIRYRHRADASWPVDFEALQSFTLEGSADSGGLRLEMEFTNLAPHAVPAGLGWHPFFAKRKGMRVSFNATGRWENGPDQLPSHRLASTGLDVPVDTLSVDHCFEAWTGRAQLTDPQLQIRITSSLRHLVVYTLPARTDIAIEPVSHTNNAMGAWACEKPDAQALGVIALEPGAKFSCTMRIDIQPTLTEHAA